MRGWHGIKRENHPKWRGGRHLDKDGYVLVYAPDHKWPRRGGYIREHILVTEQIMGRRLGPGECVHHYDRDRKNNCADNLVVVKRGTHSKQHRLLDSHKFKRDAKGRYVGLPR